MNFEFKPSFGRSIKALHVKEKEDVKRVALRAMDILSRESVTYEGIGLKRLRGNFWEVRSGIRARILFRWENGLVEFILAGDHNDIRRYLKNI